MSSDQSDIEDGAVYWRTDLGEGSFVYFLRQEDGGIYIEIRHGGVALDAGLAECSAESLLQWLDRSRG